MLLAPGASWLQRHLGPVAAAVAVAVGALLPVGLGGYPLHLATEMLVWALAACALDLLVGYAGLVSLGQAAFFGLGAYTVAILATRVGVTQVWATLSAAAAMAATFAAVTGPFVLRGHGIYFLMLTLAFAQMVWALATQWVSLTRGDDGISGVPPPAGLEDPRVYHLFVFAVVALCIVGLWRLVHSPFGRVLSAIRQNEGKARALGYPGFWYKFAALVLSAALTGLAGALYLHQKQFVHPHDAYWTTSGILLVMVLLGGRRSIWGGVLGAVVYVLFEAWVSARTGYWQLLVGLLLVATVLINPGGLWGLAEAYLQGVSHGRARGAAGVPTLRRRAGPGWRVDGGDQGGAAGGHRAQRSGQEHAVPDYQR